MIPTLLLAAAISFPAGPQTRVVVEMGAGDVRIAGERRDDIVVEARGATAVAEGDRITVRGADASGTPDRDSRARVEMRVPPNTVFDSIRIVDGSLALEGLTGRVGADVRNGRIIASRISGVMRLETGFGDVVVERATLSPGGLLRLRAFNGDVRLALEAVPADARILALTFNGTIESNLPLARKEAFGPKFAEATFGKGEPLISIDSIAGTITITAAASPRR